MRPDRAGSTEALRLLRSDLVGGQRGDDSAWVDRPRFSFGERLLQVRQVGERRHLVDAGQTELTPSGVEIELAFEMVHSGLEESLAVEPAPKTDRAQLRGRSKGLVGEIAGDLMGGEVDVGKHDDRGLRLLDHLGSPACFLAGVESLTALESEFLERGDESGKVGPAGAVGVVVVVSPAEAEFVLPGLLSPRGPVATRPVPAFGGEEEVASPIDAQIVDRGADEGEGVVETGLVLSKVAVAPLERPGVASGGGSLVGGNIGRLPAAPAAALDCPQFGVALVRNSCFSERAERPSFNGAWAVQAVSREKVVDGVNLDCRAPRALLTDFHRGKQPFRVTPNGAGAWFFR